MRRLPPRSLVLLALAAVLALATARQVAGDLAALHRRADGPARPAESGDPPPGARPRPPGGPRAALTVPPGTRAVRITVEPPWVLPPGSVVDVVGLDSEVVAEGAVVLREEKATRVSNPAGITLLITVEASRRVAAAAAAGPLALALAPPEDACCRKSSSVSSKD